MENTNEKNSIDTIINIFKDAALTFVNSFNKNLRYYFKENIKENEIIVLFDLSYDRHLRYEIKLEKAKKNFIKIPNVKGYEKIEDSSNPYKQLSFSDENFILGNIYDNIIKYSYTEIVCYKKIGIIVKNPIDLEGIYNINVRYIGE